MSPRSPHRTRGEPQWSWIYDESDEKIDPAESRCVYRGRERRASYTAGSWPAGGSPACVEYLFERSVFN